VDKTRVGFYPVPDCFNPETGNKEEFCISSQLVEQIENSGRSTQYYNLISACEVLNSPNCVYKGLNRKSFDNALCYVGVPRRHGKDWEGPAKPGFVFIVCVTEDKKIFEWGWEKSSDSQNCEMPENGDVRFKKLIWKRCSNT
jgi:hypothetical protein